MGLNPKLSVKDLQVTAKAVIPRIVLKGIL
jgi:hypothetical protein